MMTSQTASCFEGGFPFFLAIFPNIVTLFKFSCKNLVHVGASGFLQLNLCLVSRTLPRAIQTRGIID